MPRRRAITVAAAALLIWAGVAGSAHATDVTFVAWNVRNYILSPGAASATTPKTRESAQSVAETLAELQPDIVALMEIGSDVDLGDLQTRLQAAGIALPHRTLVEGADNERHLALLSRYPLRDLRHDTGSVFRMGGLPQRMQRGMLDCTVELDPDFALRILGVHLKSRRPSPDFDQAEFRRNESLLLRAKAESILDGDPATPLLLFGDFNDTKNSPTVASVAGRRGGPTSLEILDLADESGDRWTYHWPESDEYSRVDFVMVGKALLPLVREKESGVHRAAGWSKASDHRPLVVKIALPPTRRRR